MSDEWKEVARIQYVRDPNTNTPHREAVTTDGSVYPIPFDLDIAEGDVIRIANERFQERFR